MKSKIINKILHIEILSKIRKSILIYVIIFFVTWVLSFFLFPKIYPFLVSPYYYILKGEALIFTSLEEALMVVLRTTFYLSLILTLPFLIVKLWHSISSEFYEKEKIFLKKFTALVILFAIIGLLLGYFIFVPFFLKLFLYFGKDFTPNIKIGNFLIFLMKTLFFSVIVLEMPLVLSILIKQGILTEKFYKKKRLYFLGFFYGIAFLLVPMDFFTQILLTFFFFCFFKLSFLIAKIL